MKRLFVGLLAALFVAGSLASVANADRRNKRGKRAKQARSAEIAKALGDLKWGMSRSQLMKQIVGKMKEEYRAKLAKAHDAITEDELRYEMRNRLRALRDSRITFDGNATGWDVSFLKGEFAHGTGESMLVLKDGNSQNFYFFINDKLWKWYKAFDSGVFSGKGFDGFARLVQAKFGKAKRKQEGDKEWLEWQSKNTRLRALDKTRFYGFYCLVFEHKPTLAQLASLRRGAIKEDKSDHTLVDAVTAVDDGSAHSDEMPNIADRITGKIRAREDAPAEGAKGAKKSGKRRRGSSSSSSSRSSSSPSLGVSEADDPLKGLGL